MTHFTVLVCVKDDPDDLNWALAPFDENKEVSPYQEKDGTMSTYNPDSKWDWFTVGGRWGGTLLYKEGHNSEVILPERQWSSPEKFRFYSCDGGRKRALDLEKMRDSAAAEARETFREYEALTAGTPEALPFRVFGDNISEGNGYTAEQARAEYRAQPRIEKLKGTKFDRLFSDLVEEFEAGEDEYARRASASAVPGYALLTLEREWIAPGEMGWFGMSTDGQGDRDEYTRVANEYIDRLPDSTWLILVDCHI